jgi:multiple sugar transport system ATP-binding protein
MHGLEFKSITKRFGRTEVLRDVCLDVEPGEFLTVLGPSGCGKSTLLRLVAGLERETSGQILIGGQDVGEIGPADRNIAMVFQSYALYPHLTVEQNIALPLRVRRLSRLQRCAPSFFMTQPARRAVAAIGEEVRRIAESLGIEPFLARRPHELSGGQRQRVALARAMIRKPQIFLMDEPLSSLDAKLRVQMRAEIVELHRRLGTTFIYVTHDQVEALTMSDRVAVMLDGRIAQIAPPRDIYRDPATIDVACFVGTPQINLCTAQCDHLGRVFIGSYPTGLSLRTGDSVVRIAIRPEAIRIVQRGIRPTIPALITHAEHLGPETLLHLKSDDAGDLVVRIADGHPVPTNGSAVAVTFDPDALLLFRTDGRRLREAQVHRIGMAHA